MRAETDLRLRKLSGVLLNSLEQCPRQVEMSNQAPVARVPVQIGPTPLASPVGVAPMAGMTDSAFRRLVKRQGGCGLVVTEMVSAEGLVRGIDRTLEYADHTEEERPVSIQIFGGDPAKMADAAQIVQGMGADIVDINMGCPVPKIAKHHAGCSLMREPACGGDRVGDGARREDSGDREDAGRLERRGA
jgi:hypothetical protein